MAFCPVIQVLQHTETRHAFFRTESVAVSSMAEAGPIVSSAEASAPLCREAYRECVLSWFAPTPILLEGQTNAVVLPQTETDYALLRCSAAAFDFCARCLSKACAFSEILNYENLLYFFFLFAYSKAISF